MVFTADGRSLISAGNHEIAFWDPVTGEQQRVLRGHTDRVDALAISRDGRTLVSGSYDHLVKVWDVASGKERLTLKGHRNFVSAVAISPDGKLVASADNQVRLWDISAGRQHVHMKLLGEHRPIGRRAGLQPRRPYARLGRRRRQDQHLGSRAPGKLVRTLKSDRESDGETWRSARTDRCSPRRAIDHGLFFWDTATWTIRHKIPEQDRLGAQALAFTADGRRLAVSLGFAAAIIDVATGKEVRRFPKQPVGINAVAVSPDGATLATTGRMIKLWDIATGQEKTPRLSGPRRLRRVGRVQSRRDDSGHGQLGPNGQALGPRDSSRADDTGRSYELRSVGRVQPRRQVAGVDRIRTRSDPLGTRFRQASPHLEGRAGPGPESLLQPGRPLGRRRDAFAAARTSGHASGTSPPASRVARSSSGDGSYMFTPDGKKLIFAGESGWSPRKRRLLVWDIEQREGGADDRRRSLAIADCASPR